MQLVNLKNKIVIACVGHFNNLVWRNTLNLKQHINKILKTNIRKNMVQVFF